MDGAQASCLYRTVRANAKLERVGGRGGREEASGVSLGQRPLVQILVVVANIQMRTLKADVEKGSI